MKKFGQKKGIKFEEIFSSVINMSLIRVIIGLFSCVNFEIEKLDGKIAFLYGDQKEEIYMKYLDGFKVKGKKDYIYRLKNNLYGLMQGPRQWYNKFNFSMVNYEYSITTINHYVYMKRFYEENFIIRLLYVDNMLIIGHDKRKIKKLKK